MEFTAPGDRQKIDVSPRTGGAIKIVLWSVWREEYRWMVFLRQNNLID